MNVIISNKQQEMLSNLNIEVIKTVNGVFTADEIVDMFSNFFFGRMILDLTALDNYQDIRNLQKISISLPVEKIIVLLPLTDNIVNDPNYQSKMISMGIYNFTQGLDGLNYLLQNPNSYRDVAHLHQIDMQQSSMNGENTGFNNSNETNSNYANTNNSYQQNMNIVLGIKSLTDGAGATTLSYLLKKELERRGFSTILVEIERRDFTYLNDKSLNSIGKDEFAEFLMKNRDKQVILVDLNSGDPKLCTEVIYLLEPSLIKLNKLMMKDRRVFERLKDDKIILCKNFLSNSDVAELEYEAKVKFFHILPSIDDRKENSAILDELLGKLGII